MRNLNLRKSEGITLIALVVTIIVLLILAGVAISMLTGENGILRQAANAKETTEEAAKQEEADLLKYELYMAKNSGEVSKGKLEGMGFTVYEIEDKYAAIKDDVGFVIDKKGNLLAESNSEIVYDVYLIKKDYLEYKEGTSDNITTLVCPYLHLDKYNTNDTNLSELLESYKSDKYTMSLQRGNLVCLYNPNLMTEEKIMVCEALGIYYFGDGNNDHKVDWWDQDIIRKFWQTGGEIDDRSNVVLDLRSNDDIDATDINVLPFLLKDDMLENSESIVEKYEEWIDEYEGNSYDNINATTEEEIKQYISIYSSDLKLPYKLIIQKGELFWVYDKNKKYAKSYIEETNISILGDVNGDDQIDEKDVKRMETLKNNSRYENVADIYFDNVIDDKDLDKLNSLID